MKNEILRLCKLAILLVAMMALAFTSTSFSAPDGGGGGGPPDGYGPGTHGRKKDDASKGLLQGLVFGDQWVVVRDLTSDYDGEPIYFEWEWPPEAYNAEGDFDPPAGVIPVGYQVTVAGNGCVQPISYNALTYIGEDFMLPDLPDGTISHYDSYGRERVPTYLVPLDPECKIPVVYEELWGSQVMEPESGRYNMSRSPQDVVDAAYDEVLSTVNQATMFDIDPAGRLMMLLTDDVTGLPYWKTVDSPAENLALYQKLMKDGCFTPTANTELDTGVASQLSTDGFGYLVCGDGDADIPDNEDYLRAASFVAGAGDKTGRFNVDLLIYLNNRLDINDVIWSPNKKEVTIHYYDFQSFDYDRDFTHSGTIATLLQPVDDNDPDETDFSVVDTFIYEKIFTDDWPDGVAGVDMDTPIVNFVRAVDDSLVIIYYIHNYAVPENPVAPVEEPVYVTE